MADVSVRCGNCGTQNAFSEFVSPEACFCISCGNLVALPASEEDRGRLQVRARKAGTVAVPTITKSLAHNTVNAIVAEKAQSSSLAHAALWREPRYFGVISFILSAGLLVGFQVMAQGDAKLTEIYVWVRYAVLAFIMIWVVSDAFRDGILHGVACVVFPPYLPFYALSRVESYWRTGLLIGTLLALCAELYYMKSDSLFRQMNTGLNELIEYVSALISGAQAPLKH